MDAGPTRHAGVHVSRRRTPARALFPREPGAQGPRAGHYRRPRARAERQPDSYFTSVRCLASNYSPKTRYEPTTSNETVVGGSSQRSRTPALNALNAGNAVIEYA